MESIKLDIKQKILNEINTKHDAMYIYEQISNLYHNFISENEADFEMLTEKEKEEISAAWHKDLKDRF